MEKVIISLADGKVLKDIMKQTEKDNSHNLKRIKIINNTVYAIEGRVLFRKAFGTDIAADGVYDIIAINKNEMIINKRDDDDFPNTDAIYDGLKILKASEQLCLELAPNNTTLMSRAVIKLWEKTKNCIDIKLLKYLSYYDLVWTIEAHEVDKHIYCKCDALSFVVLPCKYN